jgi:hypothetical protein
MAANCRLRILQLLVVILAQTVREVSLIVVCVSRRPAECVYFRN